MTRHTNLGCSMTAAEYLALAQGFRKPPKYRNTAVGEDCQPYDKTRHKERFASIAEWKHWRDLFLAERAGDISGLRRQPRFPLFVNGQKICTYVSDFYFRRGGKECVDEVKGYATDVWVMKHKLFEVLHPKIQLRIISSGSGKKRSGMRVLPRTGTDAKHKPPSNDSPRAC